MGQSLGSILNGHDSSKLFSVWVIHLDELRTRGHAWDFVLNKLLTAEEKRKVLGYHFTDDQRRSVLSILLQRALVSGTFGMTHTEYCILRTAQNKPYVVSGLIDLGSWNFNVSHHGQYVCIASHSKYQVGIDVVNILERRGGIMSAAEYISIFTCQFSSKETLNMLK